MRTTVKSFVAAAAALFMFSFSIFSQQVAKTIPNSTSPDGRIGFLEFKPTDYGTQKHPLIIFLHGIGERGNGTTQISTVANNGIPNYCSRGASMRFTVAGQTSSFVVLSPQLSTSYGYWPAFYVWEMINYAKANLQIDPNRIYVTGLSLGGGGVWGAITDAANPTFDAGIAAAAPVCGTQQEDDAMFCGTIGANHLPVWAFHSMDDGTVNVGATQHAEILAKNCGLSPAAKFTYYQTGGHSGAWVNAYDTGHITKTVSVNGVLSNFTANPNLYEWFLSNTRSAATSGNTAPAVSVGAAQTITLPVSTVTLTGTGTGTSGATIAGYAWTKTSGPAGAVIVSAGSTTTLVTGLLQGTYVFTFTATDNHGLSSSATVTIVVNAAVTTPAVVNQPPVSVAGADATITLPSNSITLDGTASYDPDGKIAEYYWSQVSGPSAGVIANNFSATTTASSLVAGKYIFQLQTKDNSGAMAYSYKTVTVNAAAAAAVNVPPVSVAGADATITLPSNSITLDGTASYDPDGKIVEYYWSQVGGPATAVIANNFSATTTASSLVAGKYIFQLQTKDNSVGIAYSYKTVTVNAAAGIIASGTAAQPIGYIKMSTGPYQACDDASSAGRIPVYSAGIANGGLVYSDPAMTTVYNGGWNWFSFTAVLGGATTYAFAIFPNGSIAMLRDCLTGTNLRTAIGSTAEADMAALSRMKDSAAASLLTAAPVKLNLYPNPVHTSATVEITSADNGIKIVSLYDANGVLKAKYTWTTVIGKNQFSLKDIAGLANGFYVLEVADKTGKRIGVQKFLKM